MDAARNALLTVEQMYAADAAAVAAGVTSLSLMEAAGAAIAREIRRRWQPRPMAIACGPGNNGGDGFVVARLMEREGWPVRVGLLGDDEKRKGDAAVNARRWRGPTRPLSVDLLDGEPLVVDAMFGAGLQRPLDGVAREVVEAVNARMLDCTSVDVPSGVHGDSGAILGAAPRCAVTVTFFRGKPGHYLVPGKEICGDLVVADIGIPEAVLGEIRPCTYVNGEALWRETFPSPAASGNKYGRGHAVVLGGVMTGAGRLAAEAARRTGAGLVTIASPPEARVIYGAGAPGTIVATIDDAAAFAALIGDARRNAVLLGPGAGTVPAVREKVLSVLGLGKRCVIDADALTVFADEPGRLFDAIRGPCVLTPHEGEFARIFAAEGDKLTRAREAARASGAVVLLKGADTVIASPDGRAVINTGAPPTLATAGSGDVLAGMILGLLAQGMEAFPAACAAADLHGRAAAAFGRGLIAEDIIAEVPGVLTRCFGRT
ncbi:MAG TPA: NAD(P)H-hydrate dehydratase [Rhodospirillales bacterium]|nr:NAD(P)H-hydrate dehydratase [Rhodospirillales bacterium]